MIRCRIAALPGDQVLELVDILERGHRGAFEPDAEGTLNIDDQCYVHERIPALDVVRRRLARYNQLIIFEHGTKDLFQPA
jgi:hypothetical protein